MRTLDLQSTQTEQLTILSTSNSHIVARLGDNGGIPTYDKMDRNTFRSIVGSQAVPEDFFFVATSADSDM